MKTIFAKVLDVVLPWRWWLAYRRYVTKISTSGYIPSPSPWFRTLTRGIFRFWVWLQVGRLKVINPEHLETPGRVIFTGNHSSMLDAVIMFPNVRRPVRSMGAREQFLNFAGLEGIALAKLGAFPVDRSRGRTVLNPAIELLTAGEPLAMFPEGKISPTGELLKFKLGAAWIANGAYDRLNGSERVGIVPVHLCYGKRHVPSALNYLKMGFRWRGGATITVCKPIWLDELDNRDPAYVMQLVRNAIAGVACATTSNPCGC